MIENIQELSQHLQLSFEYIDNEQLTRLEQWCKTHITSDLYFGGSSEDKYSFYYHMAIAFFDIFLKNLPLSPTTIIPEYHYMNSIQYAAYQGYNFFIDTITSKPKAFDAATSAGMTPLHFAALFGHLETFEALLKHQPQANLLNNNAQPPLFSALITSISHTNILIKNKEKILERFKR